MSTNDDPNSLKNNVQDPEPAGAGGARVSEIERKLMSAAEELGTWLGTAERKTTEFIGQQGTIADHLVRIRDTASRLLAQIEKGRERSL
jgi:hypothetical protein